MCAAPSGPFRQMVPVPFSQRSILAALAQNRKGPQNVIPHSQPPQLTLIPRQIPVQCSGDFAVQPRDAGDRLGGD